MKPMSKRLDNFKVRVVLLLVLLGLTASVSALALYPKKMERGALKAASLPLRLGDWSGQDVPVEEYVKEILETDDVVQRNYTSPRWTTVPVQMAVVFSADNRRVAHPPEVCYRGSGWEVNDKRIVHEPGLTPLVRLVLDQGGGRQDLVFYCYKAGPEITANYYRQQYNIALNQLLLRTTASSLIRFSTPITDTTERTEQKMLDFIRLMLPEIQKTLNE